MKILFLAEKGDVEARKKFDYLQERLREYGKGKEIEGKRSFEFFDKDLTERSLRKVSDVEGIVLFIDKDINRKIMRDLPHLKFIATMSTGYDHIDIESAKEFGIKVCNVPVYGASTVAEHTFGLILNLSRKIWKGIDRVKQDNFSLSDLQGFDLKGKTIGIVGLGNIGKQVARIAYGFDMKIIGYDRHPDSVMEEKYGVEYVSELNELLEKSDIVSLHLPLSKETKHLINKKNIGKMKSGSLLINTSRGELIETGALRWALDKGIIAGAGLDVLEGEEEIREEIELLGDSYKSSDWKTLVENNLLIDYDNVIVTPHMAFYSREAEKRILDITFENMIGFLRGNFKNCV